MQAKSTEAPVIEVITAQFSPLQMMENGVAKGYVVELIEHVVERVKQEYQIDVSTAKILPFRRALNALDKGPNVLFFSLSRTQKREDKFLWIGEVSPYEIYFFKLKENDPVRSHTLEDALNQGHRLGVAAASNTMELLKDLGFKRGQTFFPYSHYTKGVPMLFNNRFDMLPLTSFVARANICKLGFDGDAVEPMIRVDELSNPLWMVFSKGTDPVLVEKFKTALDAVKAEGIDKQIRDRYLTALNNKPCVAE